jgi:hypothetical protein
MHVVALRSRRRVLLMGIKLEMSSSSGDDFVRGLVSLRATSGDKSVTWKLPERLIKPELLNLIVDELVAELAERG